MYGISSSVVLLSTSSQRKLHVKYLSLEVLSESELRVIGNVMSPGFSSSQFSSSIIGQRSCLVCLAQSQSKKDVMLKSIIQISHWIKLTQFEKRISTNFCSSYQAETIESSCFNRIYNRSFCQINHDWKYVS